MKSNTPTIEEILYKIVANNIIQYQKLVLAFSGGLDSTVLLDILFTIKKRIEKENNHTKKIITLRAIHIHHGLSHHANYWAKHCNEECNKRNVPFNLIHAYYNNNNNSNIEATARKIRYQYLFQTLEKKEILLTAHHLDDQAETFLLALKRGSGPTGLSSMIKKKLYEKKILLRPLLTCTKKQITTYAHHKKLIWIMDNSNLNTRFDRNFLRVNILPILNNRWPKINYTIARSAQLCSEQEILLNELLKKELKKINHYDNSLLLQPLIKMSIQKRQALLRRWLNSFNIAMPSYKKSYHIWKNIVFSKKDAKPMMQLNKKLLLQRFKNRLYIVSNIIKLKINHITITWNFANKKIFLPHTLGMLIAIKLSNTDINFLNKKKIHYNTMILSKNIFSHTHNNISNKIIALSLIRAPYKEEKISIKFKYAYHNNIRIIGKKHGKKIKKIWQELEIPPWTRSKIPLLFYNEKLISALGIFVTKEGNIKKEDKILGIYWLQQNTNLFMLLPY